MVRSYLSSRVVKLTKHNPKAQNWEITILPEERRFTSAAAISTSFGKPGKVSPHVSTGTAMTKRRCRKADWQALTLHASDCDVGLALFCLFHSWLAFEAPSLAPSLHLSFAPDSWPSCLFTWSKSSSFVSIFCSPAALGSYLSSKGLRFLTSAHTRLFTTLLTRSVLVHSTSVFISKATP